MLCALPCRDLSGLIKRLPMIAAVTAIAAIVTIVTGCDLHDVKRSREQKPTLTFNFDASSLGSSSKDAKSLRVRLYPVIDEETLGSQEGDDRLLTFDPAKTQYQLSNVIPGSKEIEVAILDHKDSVLGIGRVRHLVTTGLNTIGSLKISVSGIGKDIVKGPEKNDQRPTPVADPVTGKIQIDVLVNVVVSASNSALLSSINKVSLAWKTSGESTTLDLAKDAEPAAVVAYENGVQAIFDENCVGCHSASFASNDLTLDKFPFASAYIADPAVVLSTVMSRVQDESNPMPPGSLMSQDKISLLVAWQQGGFLAKAPAASSPIYRGGMTKLNVGDQLSGEVVVTDANGTELYKKAITPVTIDINGVINLDVAL